MPEAMGFGGGRVRRRHPQGVGGTTTAHRAASPLDASRPTGHTPGGPVRWAVGRESTLRPVVYRFGAMFHARWGGYLSIVLLVGLVGGVSLGALAAARRTQSSFATYLASTNPSDLSLGTGLFNPSGGQKVGYNAALVAAVAHLPRVRRVESNVALNAGPVTAEGTPINSNVSVNYLGSVDGEYFDQDRVTVVTGRMADPARRDEVVVSTSAAQLLGWHVGQVVHLGIYTLAQVVNPGSVPPPPAHRVDVHVVGVGRFNDSVVL